MLNDKRIATSISDQTIRILDPVNDYKCDITIITSAISLSQLDNGHIVAVNYDKSCLNFWSIET